MKKIVICLIFISHSSVFATDEAPATEVVTSEVASKDLTLTKPQTFNLICKSKDIHPELKIDITYPDQSVTCDTTIDPNCDKVHVSYKLEANLEFPFAKNEKISNENEETSEPAIEKSNYIDEGYYSSTSNNLIITHQNFEFKLPETADKMKARMAFFNGRMHLLIQSWPGDYVEDLFATDDEDNNQQQNKTNPFGLYCSPR